MKCIQSRRIFPRIFLAVALLLSVLATGRLYAGNTYYVDGRHAQASDENPGSEAAPFKTLSRAGERARPGDTVYIRGGVYRETLKVVSPNLYPADETPPRYQVTGRFPETGPANDRIVFEAYGDEEVIIDGSDILPRDQWQPVDGRAGCYAITLTPYWSEMMRGVPAKDRVTYIFWNGERIMPHRERDAQGLWQPALPTPEGAPAWHYDETADRLTVHLGGADPRTEGQVETVVRRFGVDAGRTRNVTVRKLTVRRAGTWGIWSGGSEGVIVEDCRVVHARHVGIRVSDSQLATVRRCVVYDVDARGIDTGNVGNALVYDNVVADFALARGTVYESVAYVVFSGKFNQFYNNVALQAERAERSGVVGCGYWTDCPGVGHIWMGNAAVRTGFYIESPAFNNLIQWNTVSRSPHPGIHLRANASNLVRENLVEGCKMAGLAMGGTEGAGLAVAGNTFIHNWVKRNRTALGFGSEHGRLGVQTRNFAQGNVYEVPADGYLASWAGHNYRTLEELKAATGQETLGEEREIDYAELGLVWVRADIPGQSHIAFPMFGNPDFTRCGTLVEVEPYFWRRGDATGSDHFPADWARPHQIRENPLPGWANQFARPFPPVAKQLGMSRWPMVAPVAGTPVGGPVLHVLSLPGTPLDEQGVGCWSPCLPTVGGAEIDLALWMKLTDVASVAAGGGAVVYVEWSDWTGQNKSRSYLVGGETEEALVNPEFSRGEHDWGRVAGCVTAPPEARRFALYMGLRSASGAVMIGAVEQIQTRPGAAPAAEAAVAAEPDAPRVDPGTLEFQTVDLSAVVNRALADEQADDGKGGWTDQGPGHDMRGLETGRRTHEGVPYELLTPKTCVVLRSRYRQQADLPEQVAIPVGGKARVLYFLHSGAWITEGQPQWAYEVHYADGKQETIPVVGGVNVFDWGGAEETREFPNTESRRTTVWPQRVANMLSPSCGLFAMEWVNPRPAEPIREIRMVTVPQGGVPILLAITLGREKGE